MPNRKKTPHTGSPTAAPPAPRKVPRGLEVHCLGTTYSNLPVAAFWLPPDSRVFRQIRSDVTTETCLSYAPVAKPRPIPEGFNLMIRGEHEIKLMNRDYMGDPLTVLTAGELLKITLPPKVSGEFVAWVAYLKAVPSETIFVLAWY